MDVPEIMQVKTIEYLKEIEKINETITILQNNCKLFENDCYVYKTILKNILSLKPYETEDGLFLSLKDISKICEEGFKFLSKGK